MHPKTLPAAAATLALGLLLAATAAAEERGVDVRDVLDLAQDAARAWADDARLVYLENDEPVDARGRSARWGLLYWSAVRDEARAYSLREDEVQRAEDLGFDFAPPALAADWIDSEQARLHADEAGGSAFVRDHGGRLRTMLLVRGVLHLDDPERTTWTCVYDAPSQPSLWIVLDATNGEVLRRWKG